MKHEGREIKGNDHQQKLLTVKQIPPFQLQTFQLANERKQCAEYAYWHQDVED